MKWQKFTSLLLLMLFCSVTVAVGQEAFIEQVENPGIEHNEAVKEFTSKYASGLPGMEGSLDFEAPVNNRAIINQMGDYNVVTLRQFGSKNWGLVDIDGNQNNINVMQDGNNLLSGIGVIGNNNALDFDQTGSSLGALFKMDGNNIQYNAVQNSSGITLTPKSNSSKPPLEISTTNKVTPIIIKSK